MPWNVDIKQDHFTFLSMCWLLMNYIYDSEGWSRSWSPRPRELVRNWVTWSYCLLGHCKSGMCKINEPRAMRKLRLIPVWLSSNTSRSERSILGLKVSYRDSRLLFDILIKSIRWPYLSLYHLSYALFRLKKKHLCKFNIGRYEVIWMT